MEGRGVAPYKRAARDLGAYSASRTRQARAESAEGTHLGPARARPVVQVRGAAAGGSASPGWRATGTGPRAPVLQAAGLHRRKGEPKGFTWQDYRDLIIVTHRQLATPLIWCWDNLTHLGQELADFTDENKDWLRIYRLPRYAPDLNPAEGIWSLLKRSIANFAAADLDGLVRIVKRKLKRIQYRPHLVEGCLAETGLKIELSCAKESETPAGC